MVAPDQIVVPEHRKRRAFIASMIAVVGLIVLVAALVSQFAISRHEARQEVHDLCNIINLVVATPVPSPIDPVQNPSRTQLYNFYNDFKKVQHDYGC